MTIAPFVVMIRWMDVNIQNQSMDMIIWFITSIEYISSETKWTFFILSNSLQSLFLFFYFGYCSSEAIISICFWIILVEIYKKNQENFEKFNKYKDAIMEIEENILCSVSDVSSNSSNLVFERNSQMIKTLRSNSLLWVIGNKGKNSIINFWT